MFCPAAPVWGDIATWATGMVTFLTLLFAVFQWSRLRKQSIAERAASAAEERVAQARRVSAWFDGSSQAIGAFARLTNSSYEPVYNVVVHEVYADGGDRPGSGEDEEYSIRETLEHIKEFERRGFLPPNTAERARVHPADQGRVLLQVVPPGTYRVQLFRGRDNAGLEIAFTDAAGRHWVRRADGKLQERDSDGLKHHNIKPPVRYSLLLGSD